MKYASIIIALLKIVKECASEKKLEIDQ